MKLAEHLRFLMDSNTLGERELSRRSNVPQPVIHRILNGKTPNPTIETLQKLAGYFTLSVSELTGETPRQSGLMTGMRPDHQGWERVPVLSKAQILEYLKTAAMPLVGLYIPIDLEIHPDIFAMLVADDSMSPLFSVEDKVIIDAKKTTPTTRSFVLVRSQDQLLLRECAIKNEALFLKTYHPLTLKPLNASQVIIGTVIQCKKDFPS